MAEKKLYLVDGYALIYRAYYALIKNPLTNARGEPTGALFGFASYLLRLLETYDCPYVAVVMDSPKPTFRHEMYDQYKANRAEMPDDLKVQIPVIRQFIETCNVATVIQEGLEADDLIARLTHDAVDDGFEVFLVTRDKDLMQLIGPHVTMLAPEGSGTLSPLGVDEVFDKMGVRPDQIVDYLSLIGDASDNIPGVPGVGPKTAKKILGATSDIETLLKDVSVLANPRLIDKIEGNRELLLLSKRLVTLRTDKPVSCSLEDLARKPVNGPACTRLLRDMECRSLLRSPLLAQTTKTPETAVTIVNSAGELPGIAAAVKEHGRCALLSLSSETPSVHSFQVGLAIALDETRVWYIPTGHLAWDTIPPETVYTQLKEVLESPDIYKTGHNLKQEIHFASRHGVSLRGLTFDTMIAAYLLDPGKRDYDCAGLVDQWLMRGIDSTASLFGSGRQRRNGEEIPVEEAGRVVSGLAAAVISLEKKLRAPLHERNSMELYETIEMPLVPVLAGMERQGIRIDIPYLGELSEEYAERAVAISRKLYDMAGEEFNINSPKQIGEVLFDRLGLPAPKKTKTGAHSTSVVVLEKLADEYPIARKILDYRELQKLLSTYIDALPAQAVPPLNRVHTSFNQTVTATGRLSSTDPNLQNIPVRSEDGKRIRNAFIPAEDMVLVSADYSQIELRILAHLSDDPFLKQAFEEDRDIHTQTASAIYQIFPEMVTPEMRRAAKTINFGLMYGMGPINLARQLGIPFTEARSFIDAYFQQFPTIKRYMESTIESARKLGYTETLLGRRRYLPEIAASNRVIREAAERTAINTPVQGTAADIIKIAMIAIDRTLTDQFPAARMLLQVHDELVFEIDEEHAVTFCEWVKESMSGAYGLSVPLKVDAGIGKNWNEAH